MSETYNYEEGAIHNDHKKVLHIETVGSNDIGKLISAFFADDAEEAIMLWLPGWALMKWNPPLSPNTWAMARNRLFTTGLLNG